MKKMDSEVKIHLLSDLHLELLPPSQKKTREQLFKLLPALESPKEIILVLAGDIGNPFDSSYSEFLQLCSDVYYHVIIVAGNHEFYNGQHMDFVVQKIRRIVDELDNVHFLNVDFMTKPSQVSVVIDEVVFIGTTLWSNLSSLGPFGSQRVRGEIKRPTINDFSCINKMSKLRYHQLHLLHAKRLKDEIDRCILEYSKIVVVTHHLPTYKLIPTKYQNMSEYFPYYASDCSDILSSLSQVIDVGVWLCGHSHGTNHTVYVSTEGKIDLYLNPIGYKDEKTDYDGSLIIKI